VPAPNLIRPLIDTAMTAILLVEHADAVNESLANLGLVLATKASSEESII
jgi:hypothetical protein